ncbi:MAG: hypothetical protein ACI8TF_001123 [Paracoccaceae bacterium]|jgi:hypothetical protein
MTDGSNAPSLSRTEPPAAFCAAITVNAMDVVRNATAKNQVNLPTAEVPLRPLMAPPPPPIPRPPPSDRCNKTTPIRQSAKIRWMTRTTFSIFGSHCLAILIAAYLGKVLCRRKPYRRLLVAMTTRLRGGWAETSIAQGPINWFHLPIPPVIQSAVQLKEDHGRWPMS